MSDGATSTGGRRRSKEPDDRRPGERSPPGGLPRLVAVVISVSAVAIAAVRLAWPDLKLDSVTLALLIVALIPWLAPVLRSLKVFGVEVDFQEFRQEVTERLGEHEHEIGRQQEKVEDIESTVQRLAPLVISGGTREQQAFLEGLLGEFNEYLRSLDITLNEPPGVSLETDVENAYYVFGTESGEAARIVVDKDLAGDPDVVLREYLHHVLYAMRPDQRNTDLAVASIESGLADYLVCSFGDSPVLAARAALVYREVWGLDRPYIRNLKNTKTFTDVAELHDVGEVWGAAFWGVRNRLGKSMADRLLVAAWRDTPDFGREPTSSPLIATLLQEVAKAATSDDADAVAHAFAARGALPPDEAGPRRRRSRADQ